MLVRYTGQKEKMPVILPVGLRSASQIRRIGKTVWLAPTADLPDEDAIKLVEMDPHNFEIVAPTPPPRRAISVQRQSLEEPVETVVTMSDPIEEEPEPVVVLPSKPKRKYTKRAVKGAGAK